MKLRIVEKNHWVSSVYGYLPEYKVQKYGKLFGFLWTGWWTVATRITESGARDIARDLANPPQSQKVIWEIDTEKL